MIKICFSFIFLIIFMFRAQYYNYLYRNCQSPHHIMPEYIISFQFWISIKKKLHKIIFDISTHLYCDKVHQILLISKGTGLKTALHMLMEWLANLRSPTDSEYQILTHNSCALKGGKSSRVLENCFSHMVCINGLSRPSLLSDKLDITFTSLSNTINIGNCFTTH